LNKGETILFSEGKMFHTIIASASIPVLFKPTIMGEHVLVDGGLLNNFPIEPLVQQCDVIIGSHVNKVEEGMSSTSLFKTFNILERCFHLAISQAVHSKAGLCDVFIEPSLQPFDMYDIKQAEKIFDIGYQTATTFKKQILDAIREEAPTALLA
jgi:NTE family protein